MDEQAVHSVYSTPHHTIPIKKEIPFKETHGDPKFSNQNFIFILIQNIDKFMGYQFNCIWGWTISHNFIF